MINIGVYGFLEIFLCLIEVVIYYLFLASFFKKRNTSSIYIVSILVVVTLSVYIKGLFDLPMGLSVFVGYALFMLIAVSLFEMKVYQYVVMEVIFLSMLSIADIITTMTFQMLMPMKIWRDFLTSNSIRFVAGMVSKTILFFAVYSVGKIKRTEESIISPVTCVLLFIAGVLSFLTMYCIGRLEEINNYTMTRTEDLLMYVMAASVLGIDFMVYLMIIQLNRTMEEEKQHELIQYQNELLEKALIEYKEVEQEWRKNKHDFNNHLSCVDMLLQMGNLEKARAYIQNLTQTYLGKIKSIKVGNEIADAVINQKNTMAKKYHINMTINGEMSPILPIDQMDLCAILSNSIDNAIEAVCQIEDEAQRFINIEFRQYGRYQIIEITNAVATNIDVSHGTLKTTKKDKKHHGIGMTSIQTAVKKYKGYMEYKCKDHCFSLMLLIPVEA